MINTTAQPNASGRQKLNQKVALLVYKLFGGNISARRPGDPANLFTYTGPRGAKVRGLLTDGDVAAAVGEVRWLAGAHVLVGTPPEVLAAATCERPYLDLSDLRVVVADEVDEVRETRRRAAINQSIDQAAPVCAATDLTALVLHALLSATLGHSQPDL